jgi:hypothetical protein
MPLTTAVDSPNNGQAYLQSKLMGGSNAAFGLSTSKQPTHRRDTTHITREKHQVNAHLQHQQQLNSVQQQVIRDKLSEADKLQSDPLQAIKTSSTQIITDSIDIPLQVLKQWGNHIPAEVKNWAQLRQWIIDGPTTDHTMP